MRATFSRDTFLALIKVKSTTLAQRQHTGEQAFAFGLSKPAHINEYSALDGFAAILASAINRVGGLDLKPSAEIVRERWDGWLTLVIRAESFPHIPQYVGIAHTSLDRSTPPHIAMGTAEEVGEACPQSEFPLSMIPINVLLRALRENARQAGIDLPARLTVDPEKDKPAYDRWRTEIDLLREAAGLRAETKPLTPA